jgi:hypothetical protein
MIYAPSLAAKVECSRVLPLDEINETVRFGLDHGTI